MYTPLAAVLLRMLICSTSVPKESFSSSETLTVCSYEAVLLAPSTAYQVRLSL